MAERAIEDGFVDCPKHGIIDGIRCLPSCKFYEGKDQDTIICSFGEVRPTEPAEQAAENLAEET